MKTIHHVIDADGGINDLVGTHRRTGSQAGGAPSSADGDRIEFTFAVTSTGDADRAAEPDAELQWRCLSGHEPWDDNTFRFQLAPLDDGRTRLRFWQDYAVELSDDAYGTYNFNWGYYLESLRLLCTTGAGKPFGAS